MSGQSFTRKLREALIVTGVPAEEARRYTTHSFRRGAAVDVLEKEEASCKLLGGPGWRQQSVCGVQGMLKMGEWANRQSASHYATLDEQIAASMAFNIADASDDEAE